MNESYTTNPAHYSLERTPEGWQVTVGATVETLTTRAKARDRAKELLTQATGTPVTEAIEVEKLALPPVQLEPIPEPTQAKAKAKPQARATVKAPTLPKPKPVTDPTVKRCAGVGKYGIAAHDVPRAEAVARFAKDKTKKDGLDVICRTCMTLYGQARKAEKAGLTTGVLSGAPEPQVQAVLGEMAEVIPVTCPLDGRTWAEHSSDELRACRSATVEAEATATTGDRKVKATK